MCPVSFVVYDSTKTEYLNESFICEVCRSVVCASLACSRAFARICFGPSIGCSFSWISSFSVARFSIYWPVDTDNLAKFYLRYTFFFFFFSLVFSLSVLFRLLSNNIFIGRHTQHGTTRGLLIAFCESCINWQFGWCIESDMSISLLLVLLLLLLLLIFFSMFF